MTRAKGLLMGVIPKYQNHGIESAFIYNLREVFDRKNHIILKLNSRGLATSIPR